jgi:signal transduction histidine kinase
MSNQTIEVYTFIVAGTILLLLIISSVMTLSFFYQRKKHQHKRELREIHENFQREILQTQIEVQNATLQHVGQELHDNIGQLLSLGKLNIHVLQMQPLEKEQADSVHEISTILSDTLQEVRSLTKSLDGDFVKDFGLISSLRNELNRIDKSKKIKASFLSEIEKTSLGFQKEIVLFRMSQEVLTNALKHARAKHIRAQVKKTMTNQIQLILSDDGIGFDATRFSDTIDDSGAGLRNIQRRAKLIEFDVNIVTSPGQGTTTTFTQLIR